MLEERHSSELGQPVWAAGERSENGFLVGARQPDDRPSMPPGRLERFRGAVESERTQTSNEIAHEPVGDRKTCEQHSVERTRGDYRPRPPGCKPVERSELAAQSLSSAALLARDFYSARRAWTSGSTSSGFGYRPIIDFVNTSVSFT